MRSKTILETKKIKALPSNASNVSLGKLAKRKDQVGLAARLELQRRLGLRAPKKSVTLRALEDSLVRGHALSPEIIKHLPGISHKKVKEALNRAEKRKKEEAAKPPRHQLAFVGKKEELRKKDESRRSAFLKIDNTGKEKVSFWGKVRKALR